jgi:HEAT repeat protein
MRYALSLALAGAVALFAAAPAAAQGDADKKKPEAPSLTTQIGSKTIDEWIAEIPNKDKSRAENAIRTVRLFPPSLAIRALPTVLDQLRKHTPGDTSVRVNLVITLGDLLGSDEEISAKYMNDGVTQLSQLLKDAQVIVRYRAAQALFRIGPEAKAALPNLMAAVRDQTTWEIRQAAALALGTVAMDSKAGPPINVVSTLYTAAKTDLASQVRLAAVQALTSLGQPQGEANQAALEGALEVVAQKDAELTIRIWAHMAVMGVKGKIEPGRVALIGGMAQNADLAVRTQAIQALGTIGPDARSQVPKLLNFLDDKEDKGVAGWTMMTLGQIGPGAMAAVPRLKQISESKEWPEQLRSLAAAAAKSIEDPKSKTKAAIGGQTP